MENLQLMKKLFLILTTLILLSVNGNCQWYNRRYGVNDINQLSEEQLNEALIRTHRGISGGSTLSLIGVIGICGGIIEIIATKNIGEGFGILAGMGLIIVSVPLEIVGLTKWSINDTRSKSIKEVLRSTELKMGLVNYHERNTFSITQGSLLPCLSITIRF
jgi:hypothetical protein